MLELRNISKTYESFRVEDISLKIDPGDYFVILGRSGAGKTLLLEIAAGIRRADHGNIILGNRDITHARIQQRNLGLVFQDYAVFPHLTVAGNIAYPLKRKGHHRSGVQKRTRELARITGLEHLLNRYPASLSGGEIQRTVLARTLALEPSVLLLDEPLTSLDVQFKRELQALLRRLNQQGQTIVHVTHDYQEALALANRVAVMENGRISQQGEIHEVFRNPSNSFIADFVGIRNFFRAMIEPLPGKDHKAAQLGGGNTFLVSAEIAPGEAVITLDARSVILSNNQPDSSALNNLQGIVKDIIPTRQGLEVMVDAGVDIAALITRESLERLNIEPGRKVWVSFKASALSVNKLA